MQKLLLVIALLVSQVSHAQLPVLVKDINSTNSGFIPMRLFSYNNKLMFIAGDGQPTLGLFITDGTDGGTSYINANSQFLYPAVLGGKVIYASEDAFNGKELWISDGTGAGTKMLTDINPGAADSDPAGMVECNGKVYFSANDGAHGVELWVTDGTTAGTQLLKDISTGIADGTPAEFYVFNNTVYFQAATTGAGTELWVTDGTLPGTVMVKNVAASNISSNPQFFQSYNGKIYFNASDTNGYELWCTDGTEAGTKLVKNVRPGNVSSNPSILTPYNGKLYFNADDGVHGTELWVTDGTDAGTTMVRDIAPGAANGAGFDMYVYNGKLYFNGYKDGDRELWVSDGTLGGTSVLKAFNTGNGGGYPLHFTSYHGQLYFVAGDAANGTQLWTTDGTVTGTKVIMPPSATQSALVTIEPLVVAGQSLYFPASYDNAIGPEIYRLTTPDPTASITHTAPATDISIYPTPAQQSVTIQYTLTQPGIPQYSICDMSGKRVTSWAATTTLSGIQTQHINIAHLPSAVYQLQVTVNGMVQTIKLVKE